MKWTPDDYALRPRRFEVSHFAELVYERTCRNDFNSPGFCVVNLGTSIDSTGLRKLMVDLKDALNMIHRQRRPNHKLNYLSTARFDQQTTTKPHLDSGPAECFLMLGYEPSRVESSLELADYTKCAFDLGLGPEEFMASHNPMFQAGQELLRPYTTKVECFSNSDFQIICINNSSVAFTQVEPRWQGVLHQATILIPDEHERRVINSTMIASESLESVESVTEPQVREFITTTVVRRRGYANLHLEDDR